MSFFNRQKPLNEAPELPELPKLPELPQVSKYRTELPPLPSFPEEEELVSSHSEKEVLAQEMESEEPRFSENPKPKFFAKETHPIKEEPIFVRIDKYQESKENLQDVKRKILEIESLLRDIKEIKSREDSQLHEWDSDIQEAKAKLDKIERIMFQKL